MVNTRYEAVVSLCVRGPGGAVLDLEAVIDTGLSASLALPATAVASLGLAPQAGGRATLADGSVRPLMLYAAEVEWGGAWRSLLVVAVGDEALIGMRLLAGHEVRIEVVPGGLVEVASLPRSSV